MKQPDMFQRAFLSLNDVFADVFNALVFDGEQIIAPDALVDAKAREIFGDENNPTREYERDVIKIWRDQKVALAIMAIENQNYYDPDMVFRMLAYDAGSYRAQTKRFASKSERYPVISFLLNYDEKPWTKRVTLRESVVFPTTADGRSLEPQISPFFNDYRLNVVNVQSLEIETIAKFQRDFRTLAATFPIMRGEIAPDELPPLVVRHKEEFSHCIQSMFPQQGMELYNRIVATPEGDVNMKPLLENAVNNLIKKGFDQGFGQGFGKGVEQGELSKARATALKLWKRNFPIADIADLQDVPTELVRQWISEAETEQSTGNSFA